jgi:2-polyprenyl-3-methyl-5-hydroxy-6-metoxy-1,4-benzoquinol methylase
MDSAGWDARYAQAELVWGGEPNRFVAAEFDGLPPGRALDLGAGEGRNAIWLASRGWRVTAVDFSAVGIERGRRLAAEGGVEVDWVVADVTRWRPESAAFDAVIIAYLQLVADQLNPVLRAAATAVASGGRMLVVGHDLANLDSGFGGPTAPEVLYTPESVAAQLTGLEVIRAEKVHRPVVTPDGTREALDTLVLAVRPA